MEEFVPYISISNGTFSTPSGDFDKLEAVMVEVSTTSKIYYKGEFEEGATPVCFANDGVMPSEGSLEPQAKKCAVCFQNQWGSKITDNKRKGKACMDSTRAVLFSNEDLTAPLSLRISATTAKNLNAYRGQVADRGVGLHDVVTEITFDKSVDYPLLAFKAIRFVGEGDKEKVEDAIDKHKEAVAYVLENALSSLDKQVPFAKVDGFTIDK